MAGLFWHAPEVIAYIRAYIYIYVAAWLLSESSGPLINDS